MTPARHGLRIPRARRARREALAFVRVRVWVGSQTRLRGGRGGWWCRRALWSHQVFTVVVSLFRLVSLCRECARVRLSVCGCSSYMAIAPCGGPAGRSSCAGFVHRLHLVATASSRRPAGADRERTYRPFRQFRRAWSSCSIESTGEPTEPRRSSLLWGRPESDPTPRKPAKSTLVWVDFGGKKG